MVVSLLRFSNCTIFTNILKITLSKQISNYCMSEKFINFTNSSGKINKIPLLNTKFQDFLSSFHISRLFLNCSHSTTLLFLLSRFSRLCGNLHVVYFPILFSPLFAIPPTQGQRGAGRRPWYHPRITHTPAAGTQR